MDNREFAKVLLTEAAELLNEGIFKKKNNSTYNGGFEPDYVKNKQFEPAYVKIPNADIEWQKKLIENQKKAIASETDPKRKEKLKNYLSNAEEDLKRLQEKYNR